jgi:hypothetical protein
LDNSGNGGKDLIKNVESLWFGDKEVSFQDVGPAAEAYRIYQAAFDRAADPQGLLYWKTAIEKGVSATEVAQMFINSDEFKLKYGNAPTPSHLLDGFYANVLHRAPDASGYQFWLDHLNDGSTSVASVLAAFSDSPENQAQVIGAIKNGIEYMHWAWQ